MTVEAILRRKGQNVVTTGPTTSIKSAADLMREKNIAALMVVSGEATLGIVTERDIVRAFARDGVAIASKAVQEIMTTKLITGTPGDSVNHVMEVKLSLLDSSKNSLQSCVSATMRVQPEAKFCGRV